MKPVFALFFLAFLPTVICINCYECGSSAPGCGDPFNSTGSGVNTTGSSSNNRYCVKAIATGLVARIGSTSCIGIPLIGNSGTFCCSTDLCNGTPSKYQISILLAIGVFISFMKYEYFKKC